MSGSGRASGVARTSLLAGYAPIPGTPDEMVDAAGAVRPVWHRLIDYLDGLTPAETNLRFTRGDQYLRDAGVYYRHYGKGEVAIRDWPLSHIPVLITEREWQSLAAGLIQRAELLETIAADIYGENHLVAGGDLPAKLVAGNPHWLLPLVGVKPASGHFLHFVAMDLGRGPDGRWWVLGDRTDAPSGAGFALESRVATARVFADFYRRANVHRLAGFFGALKGAFEGLQQPGSNRVGILTPGSFNDTYYEQAYIARYLGMALLEGEDLVVENARVMVRTIAGPRPVSVLWRRLAAAWCDPLELDSASRLGTVGLVEAVRAGTITMINALGTGILETQALLAFLPGLCEKLRGEPLAIPNLATWWCGQEAELQHVRANAASMTIRPALSNRPPIEFDPRHPTGRALFTPDEPAFDEWLRQEGGDLVGQELATLSTTPVWIKGRLVPRPVSIRCFLARTEEGWQVMPGGFARVGANENPSAIAMGNGGTVADVWIVSEAPVPEISLLRRDAGPFERAPPTILPSRAADNLYWLGRYVERVEGLLRLLRAYHGRLAEFGDYDAPILVRMRDLLEHYGVDADEPLPSFVVATINAAVNSASHLRDRFSMDGWAALADLSSAAARLAKSVRPGDDAARAMGILIRKLTGFSGLVHENMYRQNGWRFLSIGRALERAIGMSELLADLVAEDAPEGSLDLAIEVGDSVISHRRRQMGTTRHESVVDLLVLDAMNPRAVLYEIEQVQAHAAQLPEYRHHGQLSPLAREIMKIHAVIATAVPDEMTPARLLAIRDDIQALSELISEAYLS